MSSLCVQARSVVIDSSCSQLASLQPRLTRHTGADMVHTPASWEQGTKEMIAASRGQDSIRFIIISVSCDRNPDPFSGYIHSLLQIL